MASMSGSAISSSSVQPLLRLKEDAKGAAALTAAVRLGDAVLVGEGLRPVELPRGHRRDLDLRRQVGVLLDPAQPRRLVFSGLRKTKTEHQVPAGRKHRGLFSEEEEMGSRPTAQHGF